MKFITETGSVYEVDSDNKRIRRLNGNSDPTIRQGKDGEWKSFESIEISVNESAVIFWNPKTTPLLEGSLPSATPATVTSLVVRIDD